MKKRNYLVGILISICFYLIASFAGSFSNAMISLLSGYANFQEAQESGSFAVLFSMYIMIIGIHALMAWITTNLMERYGEKHGGISRTYFRVSAIAIVVLALVIIPIILSRSPGWATYLSHAICLDLFGKKKCIAAEAKQKESGKQEMYYQNHDTKVPQGRKQEKYCYSCGARLPIESEFCNQCGSRQP